MIRKIFLAVILATIGTVVANAQFEKGKWYVNGSLTGLDLSYSKRSDLSFGFEGTAGYMFAKDWMVTGSVGIDCSDSRCNSIYVGAKCRYYIEQNGLYLAFGAKMLHEYKSINDFELTPEVGYCFFLNKNVTIEPSVYYDMSLGHFADYSKVGLKVGLGIFF